MNLDPTLSERLNEYQFEDGQSDFQGNAFDCGVFSVINLERVISATEGVVTQELMRLYRLRILFKLYTQAIACGEVNGVQVDADQIGE